MHRYISSVRMFKVSHPKFDRMQLLCSYAQYPKIIVNIRDALFFSSVSLLPPAEFLHWGNEMCRIFIYLQLCSKYIIVEIGACKSVHTETSLK